MMRSILGSFLTVGVMVLAVSYATAGNRTFVAQIERNPDIVKTPATGKATFRLSEDGNRIEYEVAVRDLEVATEAHIHLTERGLAEEGLANRPPQRGRPESGHGPTVVFLLNFTPKGIPGNGILASGTFTKADLVGPLNGYPLSMLIRFIDKGYAYVNVHTLQRFSVGRVFCCPTGLRGTIRAETGP
jgi:hypothetical protein